MSKIAPFLWFEDQAEEATNLFALNGGPLFSFSPAILGELLGDVNPEKSKRVLDAMLQMDKIDIAKLKQAYNASN